MKNRKLIRKQNYSYNLGGSYFITICIKDRKNYFGEIVNNKMELSKIGKIALDVWNDIPKHMDGVALDEFVVMPNHMHGLIFVDYENDDENEKIHKIIRSYKSTVTRIINQKIPNSGFKWQRSYNDQIIKNQNHFENVQNYIKNNPINWVQDKLKN